jgi:hypothetical protein
MKIHLAIVVTFAVALLAIPAFAANEDPTVSFHALNGMATDVQTTDVQTAPILLTDQQLAAVEGGSHLGDVLILIALANIAQQANQLTVASQLEGLAGLTLAFQPSHRCGGAFGAC